MISPETFSTRYPFPLDGFQLRAIEALHEGRSVLVAAPTGSGKTVVAEFAVEQAVAAGRKCFYTTPLKALSNQKFGDLVASYGPQQVGLLTGDNTINGEAPIVVMTTEVLRNMLYERSDTLDGLQWVVMDEVHYLQDPYRGAVWEEVLIHLPRSVGVVCLSATISNAEEFGEWIRTLRGETSVVIEEKRPVPLEHHYLIGRRLHPMHVEQDGVLLPNPYVVSIDQQEMRVRPGTHRGRAPSRDRSREGHHGVYAPRREEVVEVLEREGMLPAIYFVFSRAGCDKSVRWLRQAGVRLTTNEEAERIRERAETRASWIDEADLVALGFYEFLDGLQAGVAAHHAGMIPVFKETVEELFEAGLVKVVFATETLSLGINMPAKTVVIEDLWKFQGERHELLTPGEYTQLTGRAGRRGIDQLGHAVVVYQRQVPFERVAGLAATRTYDLTSSFRPSYNMAVNLVRNYTLDQAHELLNASFAQFLADRGVVALERARQQDRTVLEGYRRNLRCDLGDFDEYWDLVQRARRLRDEDQRGREAARSDEVRAAIASLEARRGDPRPGFTPARPGGRRRDPRREADGPVGGSVGVPCLGEGLPGATAGAHEDRAAEDRVIPQRPVPARRRLDPGRAPRQAPEDEARACGRPEGGAGGRAPGIRRPCAPVSRVSRAREARAMGRTMYQARAADGGRGTQDPCPHGNAGSALRPGPGRADRSRLRPRVVPDPEGAHLDEDLRRGRPARG